MGSQEERTDIRRVVAARIMTFRLPGETDVAFANRIGTSPQNIQNWKNGKGGASLGMVEEMMVRFRVSPLWLLTGDEPIRLVPTDEARMRLWLAELAVGAGPEEVQRAVEELRSVLPKVTDVDADTAGEEAGAARKASEKRKSRRRSGGSDPLDGK